MRGRTITNISSRIKQLRENERDRNEWLRTSLSFHFGRCAHWPSSALAGGIREMLAARSGKKEQFEGQGLAENKRAVDDEERRGGGQKKPCSEKKNVEPWIRTHTRTQPTASDHSCPVWPLPGKKAPASTPRLRLCFSLHTHTHTHTHTLSLSLSLSLFLKNVTFKKKTNCRTESVMS